MFVIPMLQFAMNVNCDVSPCFSDHVPPAPVRGVHRGVGGGHAVRRSGAVRVCGGVQGGGRGPSEHVHRAGRVDRRSPPVSRSVTSW